MHCYFNLVSSHKTILDGEGIVLFTIGFDALLPPEARGAEVQAVVAVPSEEDSTYAYGKAA